jgi:hypothetical protein
MLGKQGDCFLIALGILFRQVANGFYQDLLAFNITGIGLALLRLTAIWVGQYGDGKNFGQTTPSMRS